MKKLITENDILELEKKGIKVIVKSNDTILTPLALDRIRSSNFTIIEKELTQQFTKTEVDQKGSDQIKSLVIGSDHTGFRLKNNLIKYLIENGSNVFDEGTYDETPCDYPDYAKAVATKVASGEFSAGILIDATGIPSAIAANKIRGIRAATCYNAFSAKSSRAHNDSNILVLGARAIGEETIKLIIDVWISTKFEGGRHQKRLDKISEIENVKRIE